MQIGEIVLCVGPDDTGWPTDLALLSTLLLKPASTDETSKNTLPKRSRAKTLIVIGAACATLIGAVGIDVMFMTPHGKASLLPDDVAAVASANRLLSTAGFSELHASPDGHEGIALRGVVANENDDFAVRRLLSNHGPVPMQRDYSVGETIARSIQEALSVQGTSVGYLGGGTFSITGTGIDMRKLKHSVMRLRPDLPGIVKTLRVDATGGQQADNDVKGGGYIAMVSSDTVHYAQTSDGVKHIFATEDSSKDNAPPERQVLENPSTNTSLVSEEVAASNPRTFPKSYGDAGLINGVNKSVLAKARDSEIPSVPSYYAPQIVNN
jgi:type III secretion protein D